MISPWFQKQETRSRARYILALSLVVICISQVEARAQTNDKDYFKQSLSGAFLAEFPVGTNNNNLDNGLGFGADYMYRPIRPLAIEFGFEQVPHLLGTFYNNNIPITPNDELYLVPFGVRYIVDLPQSRLRLSAGGGGAYLNHAVSRNVSGLLLGVAGWGAQAVASGDYALTKSGRFRIGFTARYYFAWSKFTNVGGVFPPNYNLSAHSHIVTFGPQFTFCFR